MKKNQTKRNQIAKKRIMDEYHFIKEIREQPEKIKKTLLTTDEKIKMIVDKYFGKVERIILTGCGDPYMLGCGSVYAFEEWAMMPAESVEAAELSIYRRNLINKKVLFILISSSGKTLKVIDSARLVMEKQAPHFALVNQVPSPLTDIVSEYIQTQADRSDSFPTKQTTTALATLFSMALYWAEHTQILDQQKIIGFRNDLNEKIPNCIQQCLELESDMKELARMYADSSIFTFIGSGPNLCTALLSAAKMKETSQSRAEACNIEEYAHLHNLSLQKDDPIFLFTHNQKIGNQAYQIANRILPYGGRLIVIGPSKEEHTWKDVSVEYICVPDHDEIFSPLVNWIPMQLFAYYVSIYKGKNPDKPVGHDKIFESGYDIYTSPLDGWDER